MEAVVIPAEILEAAHLSEADLLQELAMLLYQQERLSLGKAAELARMSRYQFGILLASRQIPRHYDLSDLADDVATLQARMARESR